MSGAELIMQERHRQISEEGYDPEHDDDHIVGEIIKMAKCYLEHSDKEWPFDDRPGIDAREKIENYIKAGALIAAEIDRLKRLK